MWTIISAGRRNFMNKKIDKMTRRIGMAILATFGQIVGDFFERDKDFLRFIA